MNSAEGRSGSAQPPQESTSSRDRLRGQRVLLVEDVRVIADYLAELATALGCVVVGPFADAERAAQAVSEAAIDAAILDQQLATDTTIALAAALCERGVPLLYVTGYSADFADPAFPKAPILEKPFSPREFEAALCRLFE